MNVECDQRHARYACVLGCGHTLYHHMFEQMEAHALLEFIHFPPPPYMYFILLIRN